MFDGIIDEDFLIEKREDYEVVENSYSSENEESSEDIEFEIKEKEIMVDFQIILGVIIIVKVVI